MKFFSLVVLASLLISCSAKQGATNAEIQLFSGNLALGSASGGAMIWGSTQDGKDAFSRVLSGGNFEIELNNGTWNFGVIAWDGASTFEGTPKCALKTGISLNGEEVQVSLSLSNAACNHPLISKDIGSGNEYTFPRVSAVTCNQRSLLNGAGCADTALGAASSMRAILPQYDKVGGVLTVSPTAGLSSSCAEVTAAIASGETLPSFKLPTGGPMSPIITVFRQFLGSTDCQQSDLVGINGYVDAVFPNGIAAPSGHPHFYGNVSSNPSPVAHYQAKLEILLSDSQVCSGTRATQSSFAAGEGDMGRPYIICNGSQLDQIGGSNWGTNSSKYFALASNIDLFAENNFTPNDALVEEPNYPDTVSLGEDYISFPTTSAGYMGKFDGRNYKIIGLKINTEDQAFTISNIGFIRSIGSAGVVKNLSFVLPMIETSNDPNAQHNYVGIVTGTNEGLIENVKIIEGDLEGYKYVGAIAGLNNGNIHLANVKGRIEGVEAVGGIAGQHNQVSTTAVGIEKVVFNGRVTHDNDQKAYCIDPGQPDESSCLSAPSIWIERRYHGGIVGNLMSCHASFAEIGQAASHGLVETASRAGGLIGKVTGSTDCNIEDSYSTADVIASEANAAGLVGENLASLSANRVFRPTGATLAGLVDAPEIFQTAGSETNVHSLETQTYANLRASATYAGYDLVGTWIMDDPTYDFPRLSFEAPRLCKGKHSGTFAGGDGSTTNPYQICNRQQLLNINTLFTLGKSFKLLSNIDLSDHTSAENALLSSSTNEFNGVIDGNGHSVLLGNQTSGHKSLISTLAPNSTVKNVNLFFASLAPTTSAAGLVLTNKGRILQSKVMGPITLTNGGAGCVAFTNDGVIAHSIGHCKINATSTGHQALGLIAGEGNGIIAYSEAKGLITIANTGAEYIGGILGSTNSSTLSGSYFDPTSEITYNLNQPRIVESTFNGVIDLGSKYPNYVGGLVGRADGLIAQNNAVYGSIYADLVAAEGKYTFMGLYDDGSNSPDLTVNTNPNELYKVSNPGTSLGFATALDDILVYDGTWQIVPRTADGAPIFDHFDYTGVAPKSRYVGGLFGEGVNVEMQHNFINTRFEFSPGTPPDIYNKQWGMVCGECDSVSVSTNNLAIQPMLYRYLNLFGADAQAAYDMTNQLAKLTSVGSPSGSAGNSLYGVSTLFTQDLSVNDFIQVGTSQFLQVDTITDDVTLSTIETVPALNSSDNIFRVDVLDQATLLDWLTLDLGWDVSDDWSVGSIWSVESGHSAPYLSRAESARDNDEIQLFINVYEQHR